MGGLLLDIVDLKISSLKFSEYNPRLLTERQYDDIKKSLETFGFVDPIIVNKNKDRKNVIVGGHQRVRVWKDLGHSTVPCVYVDLPIEKEKELNIRLNKNTGEFDFDILANEFEIDSLIDWGFCEYELGIELEDPVLEIDNNHSQKLLNTMIVTFESPEQLQKLEAEIVDFLSQFEGLKWKIS